MSHVECVCDEGGRGGALQENKECVTIVQWWICGTEKPKNEARKNGKKFRQYTIEDSMCVCQWCKCGEADRRLHARIIRIQVSESTSRRYYNKDYYIYHTITTPVQAEPPLDFSELLKAESRQTRIPENPLR